MHTYARIYMCLDAHFLSPSPKRAKKLRPCLLSQSWSLLLTKGNRTQRMGLIPGLEQSTYEMNLKHCVTPKSKKVLTG